MPLYFFDMDDGETLVRDEVGTDLADDGRARAEAQQTLIEIARDYVPSDLPQRNLTMWVRLDESEPLLQLTLSFAVKHLRDGWKASIRDDRRLQT